MADELLYEVDEGVATVTLNRPDQRNALNGALLAALVDAMKRLATTKRSGPSSSPGPARRFSAPAPTWWFRRRRPAGRQALRLGSLPRVLPADATTRKALPLCRQRPRARRRHGSRALLRPPDRQGGRALRHARDQRRGVPLHDHVDHLPQRPAEEGQRDDAARRADLRGAGGRLRARQQGRAGGGVRGRGGRLGPQARFEEPGADATRPRRDVPPAGHGAGRRARVPALQLSLTFTTEDIQEGVTAFFEKREPEWKGR